MYYKFCLIMLIILIMMSCSESLDPNGPYVEKKLLYGVLSTQTNKQSIILSKSYKASENEPNLNEQWLKECEMMVWFEDYVKIFKPEIVIDEDINGNKTEKIVFTHPNFEVSKGETYEIWARFPDGKQLSAKTTVPNIDKFYIADRTSNDYKQLSSINPNKNKKYYFVWTGTEINTVSYYELNLRYYVIHNNEKTLRKIRIPSHYVKNGNNYIPQYVKPGTINVGVFDVDVLPELLAQIKKSSPPNSNIELKDIFMDLIIYDDELSDYYFSTGNYAGSIPIEVDQPAHNNIKNGVGLFGSIYFRQRAIIFDDIYLRTINLNNIN